MSKHIGYIRVSTLDQNTERQLDGVDLDKTYEEKISGATTKRPQLQACLDYLRDGDTLHVHSIDRLARSLRDLENIVIDLNGRGVAVNFHKENLLFTGEDNPTQTLLFQMIGAVAQFERAIIRERQAEGIAKAKAKGKYKGRKPKLSEGEINSLKQECANGGDKSKLAIKYGISRQTLYRIIKEN
jgi:DNA invertase Pin-like site-specific DNA recombinase